MTVRFKFHLKAKGLNCNYSSVNFTLKYLALNIVTIDKIINFKIAAIALNDVKNEQSYLTGGDENDVCFSFFYDYSKKNMYTTSINALTIQLIPTFIKSTYDSIQPVINRIISLYSQSAKQEHEKDLPQTTTTKRLNLHDKSTKHSHQIVKDTTKQTTLRKSQKLSSYPSLLKSYVEETEQLIEINFVLNTTKLIFKNCEGNGLTASVSFEGNLLFKGTEMVKSNIFSQHFDLIGMTNSRKNPLTIIQLKSFNVSYSNIDIIKINVGLRNLKIRLSNRDIEITLILLKEFNENLAELFYSRVNNKATVVKPSHSGFVIEQKKIEKTTDNSKTFKLPTIAFALSYENVKLFLANEFINQEGKIIESVDALTFKTNDGLFEINKQQFEATINLVECCYFNLSLGIKEPLVEPFDIRSTSILPNINIVISPTNHLLIDITPELFFTLKQLLDNWAKAINPNFIDKKGICTISNNLGVKLSIYHQNKYYIIDESKTMEIPYTGLSFLTLFIDKYIPLYLNLKDEKRSYPLLLKNKEYGYVVVKTKTFQNSQIIKVTSPIHFENKTTIQLKIRHNKNELTLEPNCSKFFNQIILTQNLKCYLFSENYPRNGIELYISKQLVSATQNNLRKKEKSVFIGEHFKMSIIFNDSIPMCTKYLDPVVVRFEPVFEIVNNLPFKLYFECKLDMKNNNTLSPSRSPILKHMFSKCEFQKKIIFQPKTNFKTETDSEEKGCHLTNSQIFTVDPFSKGSISIASPIDSFVYYLTILEVQQKFDFKENEVKSNLITFSPNNKKLPFVKVGKHQFIQKLKGNQIIIESPYFLKNETQLLLSVYDYGFLSPTNKYQIYAPIFVQKNILDKNANVIKFGNTKINKEKNEQLELQLGVEKVFNIKENGIVHNIIAQVNPYSDEDINTLCILFKNHFIIENSIDEEIRISNGLKSVTLLPNKQTPIHFEKVMISLKNGESGVILLSRVDEYQIMLTQKKTKKIYNIKTVNIKGTFKTTISGCSVPFIRLNNYTFESFWIHISNYTFVVNCQPQSTIPLAWLNPSQERVFIIDHQKINPFNVEEEIVIRGYQVLIDTEDCTTTITIGTEKRKKEKLLATLSLRIPVVGVSLFKSKAIEELSITINEVRMFILYMDRHVGVEFQFDYLQIDSQELQKECCPVIVSPTPLDWIYNPNESYFHLGFIMVVTPKRSSLKLLYFSEFSVCIQPTEVFLEPFILKKLYNTFKQYPTDIIPQLNDSNSTSTTEVRCIIRKVTINAWNINFSIGKECTEPPKHATFLNIVKHATELGLERIPITLSKQNYENKVLPFGLLSSEIFESFKTDVDSMKWVLVGKIFGFQTLARKSEDMDNKKQEKVFLCTSDLIPLTTKQYIVKSFGRTNDCLLEPNLNETRTQTKSKKFWKRTESPTIKTVPQTMVNAQKSTIHYSIMDGTKNFGKSLVKGVKGLWKTPVSLTEIAGEQNKKLAPVGFMSGVVIGAAGVFVKPIDGAIGFFKSLNDGLTGISFGQIAKERMRPPRLCRGSIVVYNYFESQGRSYLYEADDKEYYNSTFVTWIKQVKESEIYGIIFTSKCMIGINKKIGSSAVAEWKIPYIMIQEFGLDNDIIIVTVKPNEKNRKRIKDNQVLLYYWSSEWIQNISSIIKTIKRNIEKYD